MRCVGQGTVSDCGQREGMMSLTGGGLHRVVAGEGAVAAGVTVGEPGGAERLARPGNQNQVPSGPHDAAQALHIARN